MTLPLDGVFWITPQTSGSWTRAQSNGTCGTLAAFLIKYICRGMEIRSHEMQIANRRAKRDLLVLLVASSAVKLRR